MNLAHNPIPRSDREQTDIPTTVQRLALLFTIVITLLLPGIAAAAQPAPAPLAVWAIGLPNGYVVMEHQARTVEVTAADVSRGMIQVLGGTRIVVTTTDSSAVALDFRPASGDFLAVGIDAAGRSVELGEGGTTIAESDRYATRRTVTVNYRFTLAPDMAPGSYIWPVAVFVRNPAPAQLTQLVRIPGAATASAGLR